MMDIANDFTKTMDKAEAASRKDGRLRFVHSLTLGYRISLKRDKLADCYWTNGVERGFWKAGASSGEAYYL